MTDIVSHREASLIKSKHALTKALTKYINSLSSFHTHTHPLTHTHSLTHIHTCTLTIGNKSWTVSYSSRYLPVQVEQYLYN